MSVSLVVGLHAPVSCPSVSGPSPGNGRGGDERRGCDSVRSGRPHPARGDIGDGAPHVLRRPCAGGRCQRASPPFLSNLYRVLDRLLFMRFSICLLTLALLLAAALAAGCTNAAAPPGNQSVAAPTATAAPAAGSNASPEELVAFVERAYEFVHVHGQEAALREFNNRTGRFVDGDRYVYAYDVNGTLLAHPYQPDLVGTDRTNWTDVRGLPFVRVGNATAANGGGFIAYLYPAPRNGTINETAPEAYEPKLGYVAPAGEGMWVGSGAYLGDMAHNGTGPDPVAEMVGLVERCAAYGRAAGATAAFSEISNRSGPFVDGGGHYIYAYDYNGTLLAHPHLSGKVGTSLIERRDPFGMENIRALAETARSGGGYIVFIWPNPENENRDELKIGYVLPVDDTWWVGSGTYLGEITGTDASLSAAP